jgi:hypothetical protein
VQWLQEQSLAATDHVERWACRLRADTPEHSELRDLAEVTRWHRQPQRTASVARGIYLRLPIDAKLWLRARTFVGPDAAALLTALTIAPRPMPVLRRDLHSSDGALAQSVRRHGPARG